MLKRMYRAAHAVNQKEPHPCGSGIPMGYIPMHSFRKSPIRADRALRSAHLRHAECAPYLRLSFVFIIHALEALYDLNNYDC